MEQVARDINVRSKDEPQTYVINPQEPTNDEKCFECDDFFTCDGQCDEVEDEPHIVGKHADVVIIDDSRLTAKCLNCNNSKACKEKHWDGCVYEPIEDEPQVIMPKKCKGCDSASKIIEAYSRGFEDGAEAVKAMP